MEVPDYIKNAEPKTVVIIGVTRSGTSMVSKMVHALGVPTVFNNNERPPSNMAPLGDGEDKEILGIISNEIEQGGILRPLIELAEKRTKENNVWGFKITDFHLKKEVINRVVPCLVNPYFIFVFRNPVGRAFSYISSKVVHGPQRKYNPANFDKIMQDTLKQYQKLLETMRLLQDHPQFVIDYEFTKTRPGIIGNMLCGWLGLKDITYQEMYQRSVKSVLPLGHSSYPDSYRKQWSIRGRLV